jgi:predicted O-linked N-acetylglucosamine transferase (SPINDLY family)
MGVPVLTFMAIGAGGAGGGEAGQGAQLAARMGASILYSAGLPELVAQGVKDYEQQAVRIVAGEGMRVADEGHRPLLRVLRAAVEGGEASAEDRPTVVAALSAAAKLRASAGRSSVPPLLDMNKHARSMEHAFMAAVECRTGAPLAAALLCCCLGCCAV